METQLSALVKYTIFDMAKMYPVTRFKYTLAVSKASRIAKYAMEYTLITLYYSLSSFANVVKSTNLQIGEITKRIDW